MWYILHEVVEFVVKMSFEKITSILQTYIVTYKPHTNIFRDKSWFLHIQPDPNINFGIRVYL